MMSRISRLIPLPHRLGWSQRLTMPDSHPPLQTSDSFGIKDVPDHPVRFHLVEPTAGSASNDTGGVLASMLQKGQGFDADGPTGFDDMIVMMRYEI